MGEFEAHFATIETTRRLLAQATAATEPSLEASGVYVQIDLLARDLLTTAIQHAWVVPDDVKQRAEHQRSLRLLVETAEQFAPTNVDRATLQRILIERHPLRNAIEHHGRQSSVEDSLDYLELVESLAFSITEPPVPGRPQQILVAAPGFKLLAGHEITRGQGEHPWYVVHGSKQLKLGSQHVIEFWRFDSGTWELGTTLDLGGVYVATVQRIETRSPTRSELLVWRRFGESMGSMSYDVVSCEEASVWRLLGRASIPGAYVTTRGRVIEELAGDRLVEYVWDGSAYVGRRAVRQVPAPLETIDVHYEVRTGVVRGTSEVQARVGQTVRLLRDDLDPTIVRTLSYAGGTLEASRDGVYRASAPGQSRLTLIPDVYDWEHALELTVNVVEE